MSVLTTITMLLPIVLEKQIVSFKQKKVKDGKVFLFSSFHRCPRVVFVVQAKPKPFPIWNSLNKGKRGYLGLFMIWNLPFLMASEVQISLNHPVDIWPGMTFKFIQTCLKFSSNGMSMTCDMHLPCCNISSPFLSIVFRRYTCVSGTGCSSLGPLRNKSIYLSPFLSGQCMPTETHKMWFGSKMQLVFSRAPGFSTS